MARGVNKVILIGNLGQAPELKYTSNGMAVCTFRLATSESYKGSDGEWQERTEWHRVKSWGKQGENCAKYLNKGSKAYVEGRLQTSKWEDREGNTRWSTEVVAREVQFLGGGQQTGGGPDNGQRTGGGYGGYEGPPPDDDDIPF